MSKDIGTAASWMVALILVAIGSGMPAWSRDGRNDLIAAVMGETSRQKSSIDAEESGVLLRPRAGAPLHVEGNLWCRPQQASSFRIISAKGKSKALVWLASIRAGKMVDCFTNRERTRAYPGPEPNTFYLDTSLAEHQQYVLVPGQHFFEVSGLPSGQYRIRMKSLKEVWLAFQLESREVQGAIEDLWRRDLLNQFMAVEFRWRRKDGTELLGGPRPIANDSIVLERPPSWEGGELTFQIGTERLKWPIEGLGIGKAESPGPTESRKPKEEPPKYNLAFIAIISGIVFLFIVLIQMLFHPRWGRLFGFRRRTRRAGQQLAAPGFYYGDRGWQRTVGSPVIEREESATRQPEDADQQSYLAWKVHQMDERLRRLEQAPENQRRYQSEINQSLRERVEALERWADAQKVSGVDQRVQYAPPIQDRELRAREAPLPSVRLDDPEKVAFELLDLIEPGGRGSPLARLPEVSEWLRKNHPGIEVEAIGELNRDLWLLLVLTPDGKTGVVVPALDSIIGPGKILKWFEGGRYDGTQPLVRANIRSLGMAARDAETQTWRPRVKGKIDLT